MKDHITSEDIANTDLETTEFFSVRAKLFSKYFPRKWVLKHVFHLSEKEIDEIEMMRLRENTPFPGPGDNCSPGKCGGHGEPSLAETLGRNGGALGGGKLTVVGGTGGAGGGSLSISSGSVVDYHTVNFPTVTTNVDTQSITVSSGAEISLGPKLVKRKVASLKSVADQVVLSDCTIDGDAVINGNVRINGMLTVVSEDGKEVKIGFDDSSDKLKESQESKAEPRKIRGQWNHEGAEDLFSLKASDIDRFRVGPNDILIVNIRTTDVPTSRIESYLRAAKKCLNPLWKKVGIEDRILFVAGDTAGFYVIHVDPTSESEIRTRRSFKPFTIREAMNESSAKKSPHNIPIIG